MEILTAIVMGKPTWMWAAFLATVLVLLAMDLGLFHRGSREIGVRESLAMSLFYFVIALAFGAWVWVTLGATAGEEYLTGYLVEKSLSLDNLFVISLVFAHFAVPLRYQHRVLFWGVLGVIVLRGIMIGLGAALVREYHWVLYVFAAFLVLTGIKMLFGTDKPTDVGANPLVALMKRYLPVTGELHGEHFLVRRPDPVTGRLKTLVTPLLLALVLIEFVDLVFAIDSIPAVFAITTDPFVVYTSNIFAILGLRSLYFALAAVVDRFAYLKQALALVLIFIGSKLFIADMLGWAKFPPALSLGVTAGLIVGGIAYSLYRTSRPASP